MGRADLGALRPGSPADIAVVSDDLSLRRVVLGGREVAHAG
jgi:adenine deaminase